MAQPRFLMLLLLGVAATLVVRPLLTDEVGAKARSGIVVGAAVDWGLLQQPGPYQSLFLEHYSSLTPENEMKMDALAPAPDRLDFGRADDLVEWAAAHHIKVHGHTLVWHRQLPAWLEQRRWTRPELAAFLRRYVTTVVRHFRGRVGSWDVINEPLAADGSLRRNVWLRVLGRGYIADALRWAHAADPSARLYINEFDVERNGPKRRAMYRLLRGLKRQGVPLDGIGLQAHLTTQWHPGGRELRWVMGRYAALGLRVDVSELDVAIGPQAGELTRQARIYRSVAAACRQEPACQRFATWGFTDSSTWLGSGRRPLPFDAAGQPKPAWQAVRAGLGR